MTQTIQRPLLRHDVAFLETQDGLYVRQAGDGFLIRGRGAYDYLSALMPHLDGSTALEDLVRDLPESHAKSVRSLLGALAAKGALIDRPVPRSVMEEKVRARFASQWALLDHFGDDGTGAQAVVGARVAMLGDDEGRGDLLACLCANAVGAQGSISPARVGYQSDADIQVGVFLDGPEGAVLDAARLARLAGIPFLAAYRVGESIVLGPFQAAGEASLESALLRLSENGIDGADAQWRGLAMGEQAPAPQTPLPAGAAELAISMLAFETFKVLSRVVPSALTRGILVLDPESLEAGAEPLLPHPAFLPAGTCDPEAVALALVAGSEEEIDTESAYSRFEPAVAEHVGIIRGFRDDHLPQIPVRIGAVAAPAGGLTSSHLTFGTDTVLECRLEAMEHAAMHYALAAARRRSRDLATVATGFTITPAAQLVPAGPGTETVPGHDPRRGRCAVPRAAAQAAPWDRADARYAADLRGLASGPSLGQAAHRALVCAAQVQACEEVRAGVTPVAAVPLDSLRAHPQLSSLVVALSAEGIRFSAHLSVPGSLIPVAVISTDAGTVIRGGMSEQAALRTALVEVAGRHQAGLEEPAGSEPPADILVEGRVSGELSTHEPSVSTLLDRIEADGGGVAFVDLTPPDLHAVTHVVRAVLHRTPCPDAQ